MPKTKITSNQFSNNSIISTKLAIDSVETIKIKNSNVSKEKFGITNTFIAPTLINSWVNYGSGFNIAGYIKDIFGFVHLRGLVRNGSGVIFTLPAGYRPAYRQLCAVQSWDTIGRCDVDTSGNVIFSAGNNGWFSLDNVRFLAEQ